MHSVSSFRMGKKMRLQRSVCALALAIGAFTSLSACSSTPYTKRSQLILVPESEEVALGASAYREVLQQSKIVKDPQVTAIVDRVGRRIAEAADKPEYDWEFVVIDEPDAVNAFALPGGKVAVYTGLFPVAQDEAGLAAVIGHEVAHALARHAGERMSQAMLAQFGAVGLSAAFGSASPATREMVYQAYGLGAHVGVLLPFNRTQESEADRIGMILMAKAGYDPAAALEVWQRMEERAKRDQKSGGGPPEFLSTHPSHRTRQQDIQSWLDEARGYYTAPPDSDIATLPVIGKSNRKPGSGF